jgi:hypothetical protein
MSSEAIANPGLSPLASPKPADRSANEQGVAEWLKRPAAALLGGGYSVKNDPILLYYLSILEVRAQWLQSRGSLSADELALLKETTARRRDLETSPAGTYTEAAAWTEVYRLERLVALLVPLDTLIAEIDIRLEEAAAERVPAVPRLRAAVTDAETRALDRSKTPPEVRASEEPTLRAILLEILEELHWTSQRKFYARPIEKTATRRIVWAGLLSFVAFVLPYLWIYVQVYMYSSAPGPTAAQELARVPVDLLIGLPFYTALTAGLFGAYFSRLLYIQANSSIMSVGELKTARELTSIFLRGSVGMCGALVVFFFLRSGIVDGSLFPKFDDLTIKEGSVPLFTTDTKTDSVRQILPSPSLALLAIWCFLAGFSERLVPSILSSTEQALGDAAKGTRK